MTTSGTSHMRTAAVPPTCLYAYVGAVAPAHKQGSLQPPASPTCAVEDRRRVPPGQPRRRVVQVRVLPGLPAYRPVQLGHCGPQGGHLSSHLRVRGREQPRITHRNRARQQAVAVVTQLAGLGPRPGKHAGLPLPPPQHACPHVNAPGNRCRRPCTRYATACFCSAAATTPRAAATGRRRKSETWCGDGATRGTPACVRYTLPGAEPSGGAAGRLQRAESLKHTPLTRCALARVWRSVVGRGAAEERWGLA